MAFKRLFFDIETSYCQGWFWRPSFKTSIDYSQIIKHSAIICICYKWQGQTQTQSLKWEKGNDEAMMKAFYKVLSEADEIVGHNSDKFDLKWVRTRFLLHGYKSVPEFKSIDTLKISRSKFNFPSNRLDAIGKYLGFGGKKETGGIELWHEIIQNNSTSAMKKMIDYCKRDVELLEKVFLKLEGYSKHKSHLGAMFNDEKCDCPYCASDKTVYVKSKYSAAGTESVQLQCRDCHKYFTTAMRAYHKRQIEKLKQKNKLSA